MIRLPLSTVDTTVDAGRARCLAYLNARAVAAGLTAFFPADQGFPGRAPDVPTSALSALLTAPQRAALAGDVVIIDVADGLTSRPGPVDGQGNPTSVITGYFMDVLVRLRDHDELTAQLAGILSGPFRATTVSQRDPTAAELVLDPGRPKVTWREVSGVRFWGIEKPRFSKHAFAGIDA